MERKEIAKQVVDLIRANMPGFENMEVDENSRINTEQGFDSMTFVYIMCKIESMYEISIPKRKWEKMVTLGDVLDAIEKELAKK
ncbi:MAG: acyl carrier protein [Erysipelotrichaceae bacterium]|nr:acyl carrier protein [Erysipelotrichaceae bacterium]